MEILDVYQFQVDEMVSKWGDKPVEYTGFLLGNSCFRRISARQ